MDIRQLRYFIAIVEEGRISAAAKRLHMSQPPLSQQLKSMEEKLGVKLINRSGRYFEVTEAGKTLYEYALQVCELMEETASEVKSVGAGTSGSLHIGTNTFSISGLVRVLQQFRAQFPQMTYKIQQNESLTLCQLLQEREIELAFIRLPLELDGFSVLPLYREPFYFISATQSRNLKSTTTLKEIKNEQLLLPSTKGLGVHYLILEAFSREQIKPNIIGECSDIKLLLDLVAADFGSAIVPETVLSLYEDFPIYAQKIVSSELSSTTSLIWLKNHHLSKSAQNFIQLLKQEMGTAFF